MLPGFDKIVEDRIIKAQKTGEFENLPGAGKPLSFAEDAHIPEDLRMAYKILKNADCLPPEIEAKKEIHQAEELLAGMADTEEKYRLLKKLNFLVLKLNAMRSTSIEFEAPQHYLGKLVDHLESGRSKNRPNR